jgi:hypothetical protein
MPFRWLLAYYVLSNNKCLFIIIRFFFVFRVIEFAGDTDEVFEDDFQDIHTLDEDYFIIVIGIIPNEVELTAIQRAELDSMKLNNRILSFQNQAEYNN